MLIFEYAKRYTIEPTSLINDAPNIWRWTNPDFDIVDWMYDVFGIVDTTDMTALMFMSSVVVDNEYYTTVQTYAELELLEKSFYWDSTNQVAYIHFPTDVSPHATSLYFVQVFGASYGRSVVLNGILYPSTLLTRASIVREVEPVTIGKLATQTLSIELRNDEICTLVEGAPVFSHRFDDLTDIIGQDTYYKYGDDSAEYADLKVLHKGIIVDYTIETEKVILDIDDFRSKKDVEWPNYTYEDDGYTAAQVGEDNLTSVIPDGYGVNRHMPTICVNQDVAVLQFDEETDELLNPPTSLVDYDIENWIPQAGATATKTTKTIAGFPMFTVEKSEVSSRFDYLFTAALTTYRLSGYLMYGNQTSTQSIRIWSSTLGVDVAQLSIDFIARTYTIVTGFTNVRVRFIDGDQAVVAYFSAEFDNFTVGQNYVFVLQIDDSVVTDSIGYAAGLKLTDGGYTEFRCSRSLTVLDKVYRKEQDTYIEITPFDYDLDEGIVYLHECDAHEEGLMNNGLVEIVIDGTLRTQQNPFDIIVDLNTELLNYPYVASLYDITLCEQEKIKLADVSVYLNTPTKFSQIIEDLQQGSVIGFRYDDIDKRYIMVDDPNRPVSLYIEQGEVVNRDTLHIKGNMTLYADEVTVGYSSNRNENTELTYRNIDYKDAVLAKYRYSNPRTFSSLLTEEADAVNKTKILLEDLSETRPTHIIKRHGLDILDTIDLYHIIMADLQLSIARPFAGIIRGQIIKIEVDTEFEMITFTVRQRVWSQIIADIIGSGYKVLGTETDRVLGSDTDRVIGHKED